MDNTELFTQLVLLVLAGVLPFVQEYLQGYYKLNGAKALTFAAILSGVVAAGWLVATGELSLTEFNLQSLLVAWPQVFALSQVVYNLVKDQLGWTK